MPKSEKRGSNPSPKAPANETTSADNAPARGSRPAPSRFLQWLMSPTARHAATMRKHVEKLLNHQRDILAPNAINAVETAMTELRASVAGGAGKAAIEKQMQNLEEAANKWLKPYPNAAWRENVEVLLVALAVAMGVRTFFLQPFKIPTGSMQPTLYGVTSVPDFGAINFRMDEAHVRQQVEQQMKQRDTFVIPTGWERVKEWFKGISYLHVVAKYDGPLEGVSKPTRFLIFNLKQTIRIGGHTQTIWFPPDYGEQPLEVRAGLILDPNHVYTKGEDIVKLKISAGDHLFVDRLTYNFRPPQRGEIVVFETEGIPEQERQLYRIPADQFYIKRLVGLGNETLQIHQDYEVAGVPTLGFATVPVGNLVVNGQPITASTPHFENLYTFYGATGKSEVLPYNANHYYGHAMLQDLEPGKKYHVEAGEFFVMGDNTMNSQDSRYFGDFPSKYVIGRACFVYWPITYRFGWGQR